MISSSSRVDQKALAKDLGITPRRVRQLVAADLLPEPDDDGYDLERSRQFYALYTNGSPRGWRDFHDEISALAIRVERWVKKAETLSKPNLAKAGREANRLFENLRFSIAATSDSDAERGYHRLLFDRLEAEVFGPLVRRTYHVLGAEKGLTKAEVEAQLKALG